MSDQEEFDHREEVVQTERGFSVTISEKRGTGVRDEDSVKMDWKLERKPPEEAFEDLARDVAETMAYLRSQNEESDGE